MRKTYSWRLPRTTIELGAQTAVMGILNITPDSFSDGGRFLDLRAAVERAHQMQEEGADVLDVGGESSRPGSLAIAEDEELRRVMPVIEALAGKLRIPISVDTYRARVAREALAAGAQIVNDISAFRFDPEMAAVAASAKAGAVLMHSRGAREELHTQPPMIDAVAEVSQALGTAAEIAVKAGIDRTSIVLDPGIGFGKRAEESVAVLGQLPILAQLDYPLLVGTSRKSFLRRIVSQSAGLALDRLWGTAASVAHAVAGGAHIVRVHDVAEMRVFVAALDALNTR